MADYRQQLAERLIHEREKRSYSQDALGLRAGVDPKTIRRIERQLVDRPRPVTIRRLAEALGIEPDELRPPVELEEDRLSAIEDELGALRTTIDRLRRDLRRGVGSDDRESRREAERTPRRSASKARSRKAS